MTEEATKPAEPKKSKKSLYIGIILILSLVGLDYTQFHFLFGSDEVVAEIVEVDSTAVEVPSDSVVVEVPASDTIKE